MAGPAREEDREGMKIVVRVLGIAAAAVVSHLALVLAGGGFDGGDANIGAGLIVFAVLVVGSSLWAFTDGWRERAGLGALVIRWAVVAVLTPVLVTFAIWAVSRTAPDWGRSEAVWLWVFVTSLSFMPALVGLTIGYAVRGSSDLGRGERVRGIAGT